MSFILQTIKEPKNTGAIAPSSKQLAKLIVEHANITDADTVVELGPGTGIFIPEILQHLAPRATFFGIEINHDFAELLRTKFPDVDIEHGSSAHITEYLHKRGIENCDRIISGLPWTGFDNALQEQLLAAASDALCDGGIFVTFSYYPLNHLPRGTSFHNILQKYFSDVTKSKIVPNIPPAFVYVCKK